MHGWELKTSFDILEWIYPRLFTTKVEYQQTELQESEDECIVFDFFEQLSSDGGTAKSYGVIMTTPFMLRRMVVAIDTQGSNVLAVTDGTRKIHFGIDVRSYRRTFKPWMYMFVQTENADAFKRMFSTAIKCAQTFFGRTLLPRFGSLDHSSIISQAFRQIWPGITLLNCYPHLLWNARSTKTKLDHPAFYESNVRVNMRPVPCTSFGNCVLAKRRGARENWSATAAIPDILPNQNSIESHHRAIKQISVDHLRADTATVLNDSIPSVIRYQALKLTRCSQIPSALIKDTLSGQYSPDHLITRFLELPATPMHWNIMRSFDDVHKPGQVIGWKANDGTYMWSVKFNTGEVFGLLRRFGELCQ
ncbi:TPA: hypothetical protein N0F65_004050 [Lagenidium giganteum]|uniref:MULE transposase domain-containing protein n=1 Tax=Lagenidium giganteum TaxID=4803 RepID=A0AAV2Z224_9STRA|nr:TPA: hypothetical protein N0F65_004050 [Lagenidium giganteum]